MDIVQRNPKKIILQHIRKDVTDYRKSIRKPWCELYLGMSSC